MSDKNKIPIDNSAERHGIESSNHSDYISTSEKSSLSSDADFIKSIISKTLLNEQQKNQVKELLSTELNSAISSVKTNIIHESQETKKDFLTMFGIFVSFLTFISIEVQLFKSNNNLAELLGLSSLFLSFLMFFALVLTQMSKTDFALKDLVKPIYLVTYLFLISGICLLVTGNSITKEHKFMKEEIKKINTQIKKMESDFKKSKKLHS